MTKTAFAFDVGNGFVKARNEKRMIVAPSVIAKKASIGTSSIISISDDFDTSNGYQEFESSLDDGEVYVWGEGIKQAVEADNLIPTYTHNNRYSQKRFKLLCSFILAELASDYEEHELNDVTVVTGVPSMEVGSIDAENFRKFLQQKHVVTRNREQRVINVTDVRIIEQPLGTLLNFDREVMTSTITLIDFGAGTTIMDTFKNLKRLDDKSETFYEGINDIHKRIAKRIERAQNVRGIDTSFVELGFQNGTFVAEISERVKYPFEDIAKEVIIEFVEKRISDIDSVLTNRNGIDNFVITGGGVHIVGETFKELFGEESLQRVEDPQGANLNGFYKLANTLVSKAQKAMA